jgi:hypothetical protein
MLSATPLAAALAAAPSAPAAMVSAANTPVLTGKAFAGSFTSSGGAISPINLTFKTQSGAKVSGGILGKDPNGNLIAFVVQGTIKNHDKITLTLTAAINPEKAPYTVVVSGTITHNGNVINGHYTESLNGHVVDSGKFHVKA